MKKIIFFISILICLQSFGQTTKPSYTLKPQSFNPGSWWMVGNKYTTYYKDTIAFFPIGDTCRMWINKPLQIRGNVLIGGYMNVPTATITTGNITSLNVTNKVTFPKRIRCTGAIVGDSSLIINGGATINGSFAYQFVHCVGSADSVNLSLGGTQNVYYKVNTGGAFTWRESDYITTAADSITTQTSGDYFVTVFISATTSNANDLIRIKVFKNHLPLATSVGRFIVASHGTGISETEGYKWYLSLSANDVLSFRVANISAARAVVVSDIKIFIEKAPE